MELCHGYSKTHKVALETIAHINLPGVQVRDDGPVVFVTMDDGTPKDSWDKLLPFHGAPFGTDYKGRPRQIRVCGYPF